MHFTINHNFNLNYRVEFKSVRTNRKRVQVHLKVNQNILHMQPAEVRESAEEPKQTFDLAFC